MEIKKYLSGAIFLILISSACAMEEALSKKKPKSFYRKNKTAVVATATGLASATVVAGFALFFYLDAKNNTIVGMRDLRALGEDAIIISSYMVAVEAGIVAIEKKLESADLDNVSRTELNEQLRISKNILVEFKFKAIIVLNESIKKKEKSLSKLKGKRKSPAPSVNSGVHMEEVD